MGGAKNRQIEQWEAGHSMGTSRVGRPPKLVTEWTADELQAWLDEN